MATQQRTVDFIVQQIAGAGKVSSRKMFGEYAIYCDGKLVALVCDEQLFLKPTKAGHAYIGKAEEAAPYKGAKPSYLISPTRWEDGDWLTELVRLSAAELPLPKPRRNTPSPSSPRSRTPASPGRRARR